VRPGAARAGERLRRPRRATLAAMSDSPLGPPTEPGESVEFVGGWSGIRITLTRRSDGYVAVSSPDDPSFSGVLWETSRDWQANPDSYELSVPPHWGGSELTWQQLLDGF